MGVASIGLILVSVIVTLPSLGALRAYAAGAPVLYPRTSISYGSVSMRTRGFLQDNCLGKADYPCLTFSDTSYKQEGTAQARAIQQLARVDDHAPVPLTNTVQSAVQWEVGPDDGTWGPDGPPDSNDPNCQNPGAWRIDIVTQGPAGTLSAYEVKSWAAGRTVARPQLTCYITRARDAGVTLTAGTELGGWVRTYADNSANTYCV